MVRILTIDTVAQNWHAPDFIKIDVEDAEMRVLNGAHQILSQGRPVFLVEVTTSSREIQELFMKFNYVNYALFTRASNGVPG